MAKKIRRKLGKYLKKLRDERRMSLNEVVAYLSLYRVKCSKANLGRIEQEEGTARSDILAALALIYEVPVDELLYSS